MNLKPTGSVVIKQKDDTFVNFIVSNSKIFASNNLDYTNCYIKQNLISTQDDTYVNFIASNFK